MLAGHDGPVSAVNFDSTGKLLASYSSKDNSIRIWKMEKGFFQELIRGSNSKPWLIFAVDKINPKGTTYKEYLDTIKLEWADDNKSLKMNREDGNMTVYNLK